MSSISELMRKGFDKILPIPKTPRVYRRPPPPKPVSWVPKGRIGNEMYEERLRDFAKEIRAIDALRKRRMKYSSRGWAYLLEGLGKIHKGEFTSCQKAINDCRKLGLLPIDFTAQDQDATRRFACIHEAVDPTVPLKKLKEDIDEMLQELPSRITDYWDDEKFYVMMCVEKGDIRNLFKPICQEYHVPIVNSKGWYPIELRGHIARLSMKAEARGLTPVLLLFYDHDPEGLKITNKFRKGLRDVRRGTKWNPSGLIIERFGLNAEEIEKYGLMWIENLKTGSGRESRDWAYIRKFGRRKCESNAIFKNDDTLEAGEKICRNAIEKYYGKDALDRFKQKEEASKQVLGGICDDPIWEDVEEQLDDLIETLEEKKEETEDPLEEVKVKLAVDVFLDNQYLGRCPKCREYFNYDSDDIDRLVRCRWCNTPMRLKKAENWIGR